MNTRARTVAGLELLPREGGGWYFREFEFVQITLPVPRGKSRSQYKGVKVWVVIGNPDEFPTLEAAVKAIKPALARQLAIAKRNAEARSVAFDSHYAITARSSKHPNRVVFNRTGVTHK